MSEPVENRILMRRRLIAELKKDAKKAEGTHLQKRYTPCKDCGKEGCTDEHKPEPTTEVEEAAPEAELTDSDLSSLLSE